MDAVIKVVQTGLRMSDSEDLSIAAAAVERQMDVNTGSGIY